MEISQKFVAFLEYMNFKYFKNITLHTFPCKVAVIGDNVQNNWLLEILLTENRKRKEDWVKYSQTEIPNILKNKKNNIF